MAWRCARDKASIVAALACYPPRAARVVLEMLSLLLSTGSHCTYLSSRATGIDRAGLLQVVFLGAGLGLVAGVHPKVLRELAGRREGLTARVGGGLVAGVHPKVHREFTLAFEYLDARCAFVHVERIRSASTETNHQIFLCFLLALATALSRSSSCCIPLSPKFSFACISFGMLLRSSRVQTAFVAGPHFG